MPPNSNYTMDGTESYVNSGFIFPVGQAPPRMPPISTFTVTFEKPGTYEYGTYEYLCALHAWMTGTVSVR